MPIEIECVDWERLVDLLATTHVDTTAISCPFVDKDEASSLTPQNAQCAHNTT